MKIKIWEISLLIALMAAVIIGAGVSKEQQELSNGLVRLHVTANSDSCEDQQLKLLVRDAIVKKLEKNLETVKSRKEALDMINESISEIRDTAQQAVFDNGYDYGVSAFVTEEDFPTREYENFSLPAGKYTALRVNIGSGTGQNWWCVMFPPLCTEAAAAEDFENTGLAPDEIKLITESSEGYVIKFKLMEILAELRTFLSKGGGQYA